MNIYCRLSICINFYLQNGCTVLKHSSSWFFDIHYCFGHSSISVIQFTLDTNHWKVTFLAFPKFDRRCRLFCFLLAHLYSMYFLFYYFFDILLYLTLYCSYFSIVYSIKRVLRKERKKRTNYQMMRMKMIRNLKMIVMKNKSLQSQKQTKRFLLKLKHLNMTTIC